MDETSLKKDSVDEEVILPVVPEVEAVEKVGEVVAPVSERVGGGRKRGRGRSPRRSFERARPEFDQKTIDVRRVTRVVAGGRRFSFAVSLALGDRKGRVGLGFGKAADTSLAIDKAVKNGKKHMLTLKLTKKHSTPFDLGAKYASSRIFIKPNRGKGLIAGSSARIILSLAGVRDTTAKYHSGSKNKLNNAKACIEALREIAYARGEVPKKKEEEKAE